MKYLKDYKTFESKILDKLPENSYTGYIKMVEETIEKINSIDNKISIRKSNNYINNIVLNSNLCKFYKKYYKLNDITVRYIPVPKDINKYQSMFETIDKYIDDTDDSDKEDYMPKLFKIYLERLKDFIIYIAYFPSVYKEESKNGAFKLEEYLNYILSDYKIISDEFNNTQSKIRGILYYYDHNDEIRAIERLIDDIESYIRDYNYMKKSYLKYFENHIKKSNDKSNFFSFVSHGYYNSTIEKLYPVNNFYHLEWELNNKHKEIFDTIEFTGDFDIDYNTIYQLYLKYKDNNYSLDF